MKTKLLLLLLLCFFTYSCTYSDEGEMYSAELLPERIELEADDPVLNFIKAERIVPQEYPDTLYCNGIVQAPPQSIFSVYSLVKGFVQDISVYPGTYVKKGQILCKVSHPEIYSLQQKFLSDYTQLRTDSTEYYRQKALLVDSATSARQFEIAKSSYFNSLATYSATEQMLKSLGFDVKKLINGHFYPEILIRSPADGIVSMISANSGAFVEGNSLLFTVVNTQHVHIEIFLQPSYYSKIKNVEFVYYKTVSDPSIKKAKIVNISNIVENPAMSVVIHCHVSDGNMPFIVGESVSSFILTDYVMGYLVPRNSIFHFDNKDYIFMQKDKHIFILKEVIIKRKYDSFFIIETDSDTVYPFVIKGAEILREKLMADE